MSLADSNLGKKAGAGNDAAFVVAASLLGTHPHPKMAGERVTAGEIGGGPENIERLIAAGAIVPATSDVIIAPRLRYDQAPRVTITHGDDGVHKPDPILAKLTGKIEG